MKISYRRALLIYKNRRKLKEIHIIIRDIHMTFVFKRSD